MKDNEKEAFGKLLIVTGELYGKHVSPSLVKLYWRVLRKHEWQEIVKAFEIYVENPDNGQFMPKPADIVRVMSGNSQSRSLKAWSKVELAISRVGPYRSIAFDDSVIHGVIEEMGGWIRLCTTSAKELPYVAKEFQTRYASLCLRPPNSIPKYFIGMSNHQNIQNGFEPEPPVLFGDQLKAQALLAEGQERKALVPMRTIVQNLGLDIKGEIA